MIAQAQEFQFQKTLLPNRLKETNRWLCCRAKDKCPMTPEKRKASVTDENNWRTFEEAFVGCIRYPSILSMPGFVCSSQDDIMCIDLDDCMVNGKAKQYAQDIVDRCNTYTEISQSGKGLHIFGLYNDSIHRKINEVVNGEKRTYELYGNTHYIAVTSNSYNKISELNDISTVVNELLSKYKKETGATINNEPIHIDMDDEDIINYALEHDKKFASCWNDVRDKDQSGSDMALMDKLAFYFGKDPYRMEKVFSISPLGKRKKWIERPDYRERTIKEAISSCSDVFDTGFYKQEQKKLEHIKDDLAEVYDTLGEKQKTELELLREDFICGVYQNNDDYAGEVFYLLNQDIAFDSISDQLFYWDTNIYTELDKYILSDRCSKLSKVLRGWAIETKEPKQKKDNIKFADEYGDANKIIPIKTKIANKYRLPKGITFNSIPYKINALNGVINLKTGELEPHNRNEYWNISIPYEYDPTYSDEDRPLFMEYINRVLQGNEKLIKWLQKVGGLCLTAESKEQKFFLISGETGTGKSTWINILDEIMGDFAKAMPKNFIIEEKNKSKFDFAELKQYRMIYTSETANENQLDVNYIKELTGNTEVTGNTKGVRANTSYIPKYKMIITTNHIPGFNLDLAFKRRLAPCLFNNFSINDNPDLNLLDKLKTEAEAILTWFVEGAVEYYKEGIELLPEQKELIESVVEEADPIIDFTRKYYKLYFLENKYVDKRFFQINTDIYELYKKYCEETGINKMPKNVFIAKFRSANGLTRNDNNIFKKKINGKTHNVTWGVDILPL